MRTMTGVEMSSRARVVGAECADAAWAVAGTAEARADWHRWQVEQADIQALVAELPQADRKAAELDDEIALAGGLTKAFERGYAERLADLAEAVHAHEWWTVEAAPSDDAHDAAFRRYDGEKTAYRYEGCDCGSVRIDESGNGANGIHTLAQYEAWLSEGLIEGDGGPIREQVAQMASRMERLAKAARR